MDPATDSATPVPTDLVTPTPVATDPTPTETPSPVATATPTPGPTDATTQQVVDGLSTIHGDLQAATEGGAVLAIVLAIAVGVTLVRGVRR